MLYDQVMPNRSTPESFWSKTKRMPNGCLEWTGAIQKHRGYGTLGYHRKHWLAHRLAWTLTNCPLAEGQCICHRCDNPRCVDPVHLFVGTQAENMLDMKKKGRRLGINSHENNGRSKLNKEAVAQIRKIYHSGEKTQIELAELFQVSQSMISCVLRNINWR